MTLIQRLRPQGLVRSPAFSHVAVVPPGATTIYVGGQNAVDADGALVGAGDVAAQSVRALENVTTALAAAGASVGDVVQWTVYLVDGTDLAAAYGAIASTLASDEPGLVSAAIVAGHRRAPGPSPAPVAMTDAVRSARLGNCATGCCAIAL